MELIYLIGIVMIALVFMYYTNKNKNELYWTVSSTENNSNCKRVCNNNVCEIECN
jgi:hypothetical protein